MSDLTAGSEEGFADLCLKMNGLVREQDGKYRFEARAIHEGRHVAFAVTLGSVWDVQKLEDMDEPLYWGEAQLSSLGNESDAFIQILDQLYETGFGALRMRRNVDFAAVSLAGDPRQLEREPLKMKLFFEADVDDLCAEFYLNCDAARSLVQFHEKDTDYRGPIILALTEATG
jgi:hypothetical protein